MDYLVRQAKENPVAFLALLGKTLPKDIAVTSEVRGYLCTPEQAASMEAWAASVAVVPDDTARAF